MVNELGEARYVRKLRGQSELWNVVEAVLLGLVCAAFCFRMVAFSSDVIQVWYFIFCCQFCAYDGDVRDAKPAVRTDAVTIVLSRQYSSTDSVTIVKRTTLLECGDADITIGVAVNSSNVENNNNKDDGDDETLNTQPEESRRQRLKGAVVRERVCLFMREICFSASVQWWWRFDEGAPPPLAVSKKHQVL